MLWLFYPNNFMGIDPLPQIVRCKSLQHDELSTNILCKLVRGVPLPHVVRQEMLHDVTFASRCTPRTNSRRTFAFRCTSRTNSQRTLASHCTPRIVSCRHVGSRRSICTFLYGQLTGKPFAFSDANLHLHQNRSNCTRLAANW